MVLLSTRDIYTGIEYLFAVEADFSDFNVKELIQFDSCIYSISGIMDRVRGTFDFYVKLSDLRKCKIDQV